MTAWIAPDCPPEIDALIRREAAERGEQVMPARPFPWNRVSSKRQALPKSRQDCPATGTLPRMLWPLSHDQRLVMENQWRAGTKPRKPQVPCDHGLFSDDADQLDLVEMFQEPTNE